MKKAYICVILTAFLFGTMEVACRLAGSQLDPFQLTFLRFAIGGLILLPFALAELKKNNVKLTAKDFLRLAGVGILGIPVSMVFFPAWHHEFQCGDSLGTDMYKSVVHDDICTFLCKRENE